MGGLAGALLRLAPGNPSGGPLLNPPPRSFGAAPVHCFPFGIWPVAFTMASTASWGTSSCSKMCRTSDFRLMTRFALVFELVMSANGVR